MAIIKIGKSIVNNNEVNIYLMHGNAVRDGEFKEVNGKELGKVTIAAKQLEDGSTMFVTVNGWRFKARDVAAIRKMDSCLVIGSLTSRTHNDKQYWDMDADFVVVSGVNRSGAAVAYAGDDADFEDISEEAGELPF